jgi:HlyD family secretion protein
MRGRHFDQFDMSPPAHACQGVIGVTDRHLDRVQEELTFAESQFERYGELFEQGLVSRERFDTAEFEARRQREAYNTAEFEIRDAEQAVEVARASLVRAIEDAQGGITRDPITIRSPIDGIVLRRLREREAVVPSGEALVEIGDPSQIEIVSDLLSANAVQIDSGDRVLIEQWGGEMTLNGRVRLIEPSGFTKLLRTRSRRTARQSNHRFRQSGRISQLPGGRISRRSANRRVENSRCAQGPDQHTVACR